MASSRKPKPAVEEERAGDNRPARYIEESDGEELIVWRASSLGSCDRALVATALGLTPSPKPAWFQRVLDEGTECEPQIDAMHTERTGIPTFGQQSEIELEIGEFRGRTIIVRAHNDGFADASAGGGGAVRLREFKKFRSSTWPKFLTNGVECNVNYPWQVAAMMHGADVDECEFVGGHVEDRETDDDGNPIGPPVIDDVYMHLLTAPPIPLIAIRKRIMRVERMIDAGFDAGEVDCQVKQYPCGFWKLHDDADDKAEEEPYVLPLDHPELGGTIRELVSQFAVARANRRMLDESVRRAKETETVASDGLKAALEVLGDEAMAAKKFVAGEYQLVRVRKTVREHVRKESKQDYFDVAVKKAAEAAEGEVA